MTARDEGAKHKKSQRTLKTRLERVKRSGTAFFAKLRNRLRPATK